MFAEIFTSILYYEVFAVNRHVYVESNALMISHISGLAFYRRLIIFYIY